jgi:hypothetical protein
MNPLAHMAEVPRLAASRSPPRSLVPSRNPTGLPDEPGGFTVGDAIGAPAFWVVRDTVNRQGSALPRIRFNRHQPIGPLDSGAPAP